MLWVRVVEPAIVLADTVIVHVPAAAPVAPLPPPPGLPPPHDVSVNPTHSSISAGTGAP